MFSKFLIFFFFFLSFFLIKVAKLIQNLTNKPNYAKEQYMLPLNPFLEENKERMIKFFNDLCEVDDFHEQLEVKILIITIHFPKNK